MGVSLIIFLFTKHSVSIAIKIFLIKWFYSDGCWRKWAKIEKWKYIEKLYTNNSREKCCHKNFRLKIFSYLFFFLCIFIFFLCPFSKQWVKIWTKWKSEIPRSAWWWGEKCMKILINSLSLFYSTFAHHQSNIF